MKESTDKIPYIWRIVRRFNPRMTKNLRRGFGPARMILLLTTTGRKSGLPRLTPLQYEDIDGAYYVASARGAKADWFRNLQANPQVEIEVQGQRLAGIAEPITDAAQIADFLELRKERHPWFIGLLVHFEGLPLRYSRADLERFAAEKTLVIIHPGPAQSA